MSKSVISWTTKKILSYLVGWLVISFILLFISYDYRVAVLPQWISYLIITAGAFPICQYTNYTLTPRYLYKRRIGAFVGVVLLLAALNASITFLLAGSIYYLMTGTSIFATVFSFFFNPIRCIPHRYNFDNRWLYR